MPAINLVAVAISKLVRKEEDNAIAELPQNEQAKVAAVAARAEQGMEQKIVAHGIPYQNPVPPAN
jgi:hypothetical protein